MQYQMSLRKCTRAAGGAGVERAFQCRPQWSGTLVGGSGPGVDSRHRILSRMDGFSLSCSAGNPLRSTESASPNANGARIRPMSLRLSTALRGLKTRAPASQPLIRAPLSPNAASAATQTRRQVHLYEQCRDYACSARARPGPACSPTPPQTSAVPSDEI